MCVGFSFAQASCESPTGSMDPMSQSLFCSCTLLRPVHSDTCSSLVEFLLEPDDLLHGGGNPFVVRHVLLVLLRRRGPLYVQILGQNQITVQSSVFQQRVTFMICWGATTRSLQEKTIHRRQRLPVSLAMRPTRQSASKRSTPPPALKGVSLCRLSKSSTEGP